MSHEYNNEIIQEVADHCSLELIDSYDKFSDFNSFHEGYAVLLEEVEELWDEIKDKNKTVSRIEMESIQVAAMAMKMLVFIKKNAMEVDK